MKENLCTYPAVSKMNRGAAGFIPHPGRPTIALPVEKSRIGFVAFRRTVHSYILAG